MKRLLPLSLVAAIAISMLTVFSCGPGEEQELDPEPVVCGELESRASCEDAEECGWLIQSCGEVVEASCLPAAEATVATNCRALETQDCHEQESWDSCAPDACRWVAPGCGSEDDYPLEGPTCVPLMECTPGAEDECPEGLECFAFTWDPCAGSDCDACGAHEYSCFPPLTEPEPEPEPDACEAIDDWMDCQAAEECGWLVQSCDGEVVASCVPEAEAVIADECRALETQDCHEQESAATCSPDACRWVSPGCGLEGDYPLDGMTCVPLMECTPGVEGECPAGLECYPFTWDPCAGSMCEACGAHEYACFPPLTEPEPEPEGCAAIEDWMDCQAAEECGWLVQSCGGEVVTSCVPADEAVISDGCRTLGTQECHEQESAATCAPEACRWVSPGCGLEGDYPLDGATCVPLVECTPGEADDCPAGLECHPFTWDPCVGSMCQACGVHEYSCFPPITE